MDINLELDLYLHIGPIINFENKKQESDESKINFLNINKPSNESDPKTISRPPASKSEHLDKPISEKQEESKKADDSDNNSSNNQTNLSPKSGKT